MYEEYFGLSGSPFRLNPDPRFFFGSRSHNKAMAYLHYGLKQAEGFIVITGPIGAGKTMLIGQLLDQLNRSNVIAAQLLTSNVEPDELLGHILSAFRIEPETEGRAGQLEAFEDYLFDQLNRGRRVLLIMDEAQNLPHKTLEELRMLSNIDYDGTPLFQVFLVGQPEFRDIMSAPDMEQLKQRVIASYHLESLTVEETREYILHRLSVAGWKEDPVLDDAAFEAIFAETAGRPRRINTLCNRLMLYCALEKRHEVDGAVVETVITELREEKLESGEAPKPDVMPAVRKVEKPEPKKVKQEPKADNQKKTSGESYVEERQMTKQPETLAAAGTMSVLDRLRARRAGEAPAPEKRDEDADADEAPPQEATLTDVATAIAAASAGEGVSEETPNAEPDDKDSGAEAPLLAKKPAEWRKSMIHSINETRDELKQAHSSVQRLRLSLKDMKKRHEEKNQAVSASLARVESLIGALRDAWR